MPKVFLDSHNEIERLLIRDVDPVHRDPNAVRFVLCDDRCKVLRHFQVDDIPPDIDRADCELIVTPFTHALSGGALLVAVTRPGPTALTPTDRQWLRVARESCATHEVRLLGVHVVTPRGRREVVLDDVL